MHFDVHLRRALRDRLDRVSARMAEWERREPPSPDTHRHLVDAIRPFAHTTKIGECVVGGVDGSGDFPALAYADSFVYVAVASGVVYEANATCGLREREAGARPLVEVTWLPTSDRERRASLYESFEQMAGQTIDEVIGGSDYRDLRPRGHWDVAALKDALIVPQVHDAGNLGVQLRTTAELAAALRLVEAVPTGSIVLTDGTMSLPFAQRGPESLFFEHLRRYCCVRARSRGVLLVALSKSNGLPSCVGLDAAAKAKLGAGDPEHWFLRVPDPAADGWSFWPPDGPRVPPVGAVSYLVRLHRSTPVMRVDLDAQVDGWASSASGREDRERRLFEALDYASHDQRSFGYPYPIKAAHDRASLTDQERQVLKQQIVEAAVRAGMRRAAFRDPSEQTGHR